MSDPHARLLRAAAISYQLYGELPKDGTVRRALDSSSFTNAKVAP
jgi:hypothetical protein